MFKGGDVVSCHDTRSGKKRSDMVLSELSIGNAHVKDISGVSKERASLSTRLYVKSCVRPGMR